jgi:hypothetical protein
LLEDELDACFDDDDEDEEEEDEVDEEFEPGLI